MLFKKKEFSPSIDFIIAGLGNPSSEYENTRHNAGFIFCDMLAEKYKFSIKKLKFKSLYDEGNIDGFKCLVMKPQTYMNKSGEAVREAMHFYKLPPENVLVVFDDISLPPGKIRVRPKGSDGGHNGMKNIIYLTGFDTYPRIKIGIGAKPNPEYDLANWVLSRFTPDEKKLITTAVENACNALPLILDGNVEKAMNKYN